jgi:hypothetical protein
VECSSITGEPCRARLSRNALKLSSPGSLMLAANSGAVSGRAPRHPQQWNSPLDTP